MLFTDLTYEEIRDLMPRIEAVFVPLGCTEQQGPHLLTDFDTWMITRLCEDAALQRYRVDYVVVHEDSLAAHALSSSVPSERLELIVGTGFVVHTVSP